MDPFCHLDFVCVFVISSCQSLEALWLADLWTFLYVMFSCGFVTLPYDVLGQVWYLVKLIPDICLIIFSLLHTNNRDTQ